MTLRLYDTARAVVPFEPPQTVRMYVCGITPYDSTHLGHAATYLTYDILIRRLEELGHEVGYVRNITDVDDSILPKARELGVPYLELAEAEMARFHSDMAALEMRAADRGAARDRVDRPDHRARRPAARVRQRVPHRTAPRTSTCRSFPRYGELSHYSRGADDRLARARGGNPDDPHRRAPARLRAVAAVARRRTRVARAVRRRPARLAHRVLGDGDARARPDDRSARWRHRSHLPAPRVRDRAEREPHRQAVRHALAALGDGELRGREDVEVARQPRVRRATC